MPGHITDPPTLAGAFADLGDAAAPQPRAPRRGVAALVPSVVQEIDWKLVVALRRRAVDQITEAREEWLKQQGVPMPEEDRRIQGRSIIRAVVRSHVEQLGRQGSALWPLELEDRYAEAIADAIFGYGRLTPVLSIPEAENIEISGWDSVVVQYPDGRRVAHPPVAESDEELIEIVRFLGETANPPRPFDDAHPTMTLALGSQFRLHAIGFGLSHRPSVIIRQHTFTSVDLRELSRRGMMPLEVAHFLSRAVLARRSIVISGDQGAGKTTLLRALIAEIPDNERFGTLETDFELLTHLQPNRRNMLALQARSGMGEQIGGRRVGDWSVADLIPEALRQNLSRLVVGEVRGAEAGAMLEAMVSGAGTLSTTHSHSAASTIDRLAARVAQGGVLGIEEATRQIAHHIDLIVHVRLEDETWRGGLRHRFISEIRHLTGTIEAGRPSTHLVYTSGPPARFAPEAELAQELSRYARPSWER
ncbi:MAG: CpaF/VirB11 family protein [Propionibacteriaceae bacterium]|nr:CpaF/VirB11 family protein [Propionibacteriaceae bacterium]